MSEAAPPPPGIFSRSGPLRWVPLAASSLVLIAVIGIGLWWFQNRPAAPAPQQVPAAGRPSIALAPVLSPEGLTPFDLRTLTAEEAIAYNATLPFSTAANPPARPFVFPFATPGDRARAVDCLTAAVYYEAGFEPIEGQRAVAQVVLNRVRHPLYPKTVCGVVFEGAERASGCQFSFTCMGSLATPPQAADYARSRRVAEAALSGSILASVGQATHYHAAYVSPYWASNLFKVKVIGWHIFYRWPGGMGLTGAFTGVPTGFEALPTTLVAYASPEALTADPALVDSPPPVVEIVELDPAPPAIQVPTAPVIAAAAPPPPITVAETAPPPPPVLAPAQRRAPAPARAPFTSNSW